MLEKTSFRLALILAVACLGTFIATLPADALSEAEAVTRVQDAYPAMADYPSDNLPPKRIQSALVDDTWYLSFEITGSGVPSILQADCFRVDADGTVVSAGNLDVSPLDSRMYTAFDPVACDTVPASLKFDHLDKE
jgi:hypothetical protein